MLSFLLSILFFAIETPQPQEKLNIRADKESSTLNYKAVHKLHSWTAANKSFDCIVIYDTETQKADKVAVSAKVSDFDSGNSSRDSHALEVLHAIKHPKVTFVSTKILETVSNKLYIDGNLTFHGISKAISFEGQRQNDGKKITIKGEFPVSLTAHDVERPTLMFVATNDIIKISFEIVFKLP